MKSAATQYTQPKSIILAGQPGSGKSTLMLQFPKLFVMDLDLNLAGPISYLKSVGKFTDFMYDDPYTTKDGKPTPRADIFGRCMEIFNEDVLNNPDIDTIAVDSVSALVDIVMVQVLKHQGRALGDFTAKGRLAKMADEQFQIQDWGVFFNLMKQIIASLKASGKLVIFNAHITTKTDALTGILQQFLAVPGAMSERMAGYFAEVWMMKRKYDKMKKKEERTVMTFPTGATDENLGLKSSSGIVSGTPINADELIRKVLG